MLILMSLSSLGGNTAPVYSLDRQGYYQIPRKTQMLGVSPEITFYVGSNFQQKYPAYSDQYRRVERAVELDYREKLGMACGAEKELRNRRIYQVSERLVNYDLGATSS
jgi:hypothetical protein